MFKIGHKTNIGRKCSNETKEKIRIANSKPKIKKICNCGKILYVWPCKENRTRFCSKECLYRDRAGKPSWNKGLKGYRLGEKHPWMPRGEDHWSWKGGISKNVHSITEPRYKEWRMRVFIRDGFKCRMANNDCRDGIQAHHILKWSEYVELRYEINNGITLCHAHHPRKRAEEKRLIPFLSGLVTVSKDNH
jgi:hypothetical protein